MLDYIDFHHDVGACGGHFQTRLATLLDFPGRVVCPACPSNKDPEERVAAMKRLASAITELLAAKEDLEKRFNLRVLKIPF